MGGRGCMVSAAPLRPFPMQEVLLPPVSPKEKSAALPFVVYLLGIGAFLMGTTEFIIAGILPELAADLQVGVARAGLLIAPWPPARSGPLPRSWPPPPPDPPRAFRALGVMVSGSALATVIGVPVGTWAGQAVGWRGTFWALAVLAGVTAC